MYIYFDILSEVTFCVQTQAGKGGELTRDETMIIAGALQLTEKTARDIMTPITETFAIELNAKLNRHVYIYYITIKLIYKRVF